MRVIAKSEAQRILRARFGSLTRIVEGVTDEGGPAEIAAIADDGAFICSVLVEGEDPYRRLLAIACQLERKPPPDPKREARERNARIIAENLKHPPKETIQ